MKQFGFILISVILFNPTSCISPKSNKIDFSNDIQTYTENPKYWQYKKEPILLLGASNNDNLYQSPDIKEQLDLLHKVGGNYIRNTMSARDSGDVQPFFKQEDGLYDLNKWNEEFWKKFENLLRLSNERDIIVQIELWDRFDFSTDYWIKNAFNPVNNINYSIEECGMQENYSEHPSADLQPFFHSITGMPNYTPELELVKKYQEKFVDKFLSYALQYNNVLYCMDNETTTPVEWGKYWMDYIKRVAGERKLYTTDMFDSFHKPKSCDVCKNAIQNFEVYTFLDVSQINSRNMGQAHWNALEWIVSERNKYPHRPINCTKTYGGNNTTWGSGSNEDGVDRYCRTIIGGCAAARHHRPTTGNGLNEKAQATIQAIRKVESLVKMWEVEPHMELLSYREDDEAYLTANEGNKYVFLFPKGGAIKIDLSKYNKKFTGNWINIKTGEWNGEFFISGGTKVEIITPDWSGWFAVLNRTD